MKIQKNRNDSQERLQISKEVRANKNKLLEGPTSPNSPLSEVLFSRILKENEDGEKQKEEKKESKRPEGDNARSATFEDHFLARRTTCSK